MCCNKQKFLSDEQHIMSYLEQRWCVVRSGEGAECWESQVRIRCFLSSKVVPSRLPCFYLSLNPLCPNQTPFHTKNTKVSLALQPSVIFPCLLCLEHLLPDPFLSLEASSDVFQVDLTFHPGKPITCPPLWSPHQTLNPLRAGTCHIHFCAPFYTNAVLGI